MDERELPLDKKSGFTAVCVNAGIQLRKHALEVNLWQVPCQNCGRDGLPPGMDIWQPVGPSDSREFSRP